MQGFLPLLCLCLHAESSWDQALPLILSACAALSLCLLCLANCEFLRARMRAPCVFVEEWVFCEWYCNHIYWKCFSPDWMPREDKIQGIIHCCHFWKVPELSRFVFLMEIPLSQQFCTKICTRTKQCWLPVPGGHRVRGICPEPELSEVQIQLSQASYWI